MLTRVWQVGSQPHDFEVSFEYGNRWWTAYVHLRPGAKELIRCLAAHYELVLFTVSTKPYCDAILKHLDPDGLISHRLHRKHCKLLPGGGCVKDISRLGRDLDQCVAVDDRPECYPHTRENVLPISRWTGNGEVCSDLLYTSYIPPVDVIVALRYIT